MYFTTRKERHISISAFSDLALFKVRRVLTILILVVTSIVLFILTYYSTLHVLNVRDTRRITPSLTEYFDKDDMLVADAELKYKMDLLIKESL